MFTVEQGRDRSPSDKFNQGLRNGIGVVESNQKDEREASTRFKYNTRKIELIYDNHGIGLEKIS